MNELYLAAQEYVSRVFMVLFETVIWIVGWATLCALIGGYIGSIVIILLLVARFA